MCYNVAVAKQATTNTGFAPPATQQTPTPTEGFLYFLFPRDEDIEIDDLSVSKVKEAVKNSTVKKLYLVVDSPGGDAYSAVKIIRILRNKFTNIIGLVPFRAMSAATLMLLGANEIYMSEESQLGPLDLPMQHPVDGSTISSLDVVETLNQLSTTMANNASSIYSKMRMGLENGEKIGKAKAIELAFEYSADLVKPISGKIDPYHRQMALRKLKIAHWYAYDLLRTGMMKGKHNRSWATARHFVYGFPDHSYAIFKEEVRESLYLTVKDSSTYPDWATVCTDVETKLNSFSGQIVTYIEK